MKFIYYLIWEKIKNLLLERREGMIKMKEIKEWSPLRMKGLRRRKESLKHSINKATSKRVTKENRRVVEISKETIK